MEKIISLFCRNYEGDRLVRDEIVPGAEWVPAGEGVPTRKYDGAGCCIRDGKFYKRFELKKGRPRPVDFIPAQEPDPVTGDQPGWVGVNGDNPADKWFVVAFKNTAPPLGMPVLPDGTYEAVGPHFQGNPEGFSIDQLVSHEFAEVLADVPRTFDALKAYFQENKWNIEGIVWHHPDGRMVKIKARDFGFKRPKKV